MNLILKGFIIGIGKIIPGISGSALAIALGVYEDALKKISNIKDELKTKSTYLIKLGIGIILAIMLTSKIVVKCLNKYYLSTILLFVGLIIGELPRIIKQTKINKKEKILILIITLLLTIFFFRISIKEHTLEKNMIEIFKLVGIGILDSISSIIPGISGTALLMSLGYYEIVLNTFSTILSIDKIRTNLFVILPFTTGFIMGTIIISKIITYLFKNYKKQTYIAVISFSLLSIILLLKRIDYKLIEIVKNIPFLIIGLIISRKIDK